MCVCVVLCVYSASYVFVVMNAHLFIIYRPECVYVCVRVHQVPSPVSAGVHRIDVLNDSAQES